MEKINKMITTDTTRKLNKHAVIIFTCRTDNAPFFPYPEHDTSSKSSSLPPANYGIMVETITLSIKQKSKSL